MFTTIIPVRVSSSRLPGKALLPIGSSNTLIEHVISRVKQSKFCNNIILATSTSEHDSILVDIARSVGVNIYRGSLDNVFSRFQHIASRCSTDYILRINGDCPYIDPLIIDLVCLTSLLNPSLQYISSTLDNTWPIGQHVESIKSDVVSSIPMHSLTDIELEHVTPYIYNNPLTYNCYGVPSL